MAQQPNRGTGSTTWEFRRVKVRKSPAGPAGAAPKGRRWFRHAEWPRRRPLTITVLYRGGSECWYQVEARGSMGRFHGATAIHDVMTEIMGHR